MVARAQEEEEEEEEEHYNSQEVMVDFFILMHIFLYIYQNWLPICPSG